jgi:hypothetical protein
MKKKGKNNRKHVNQKCYMHVLNMSTTRMNALLLNPISLSKKFNYVAKDASILSWAMAACIIISQLSPFHHTLPITTTNLLQALDC